MRLEALSRIDGLLLTYLSRRRPRRGAAKSSSSSIWRAQDWLGARCADRSSIVRECWKETLSRTTRASREARQELERVAFSAEIAAL
jgi:hypothetical protein